MPDKKNDISVCLANYDAYENIPTHTELLGKISADTANAFLSALSAAHPADNACIKTLSAEYTDSVTFGHLPGQCSYRKLELRDMWWLNDNCILPCATNKRPDISYEQRMRICARNLRKGKCCDTFIRQTLGAALFPKLYKNEKQR